MFAQESVMDVQKIKELALANGFSLKEQASGNMDLHSYVYEFANAIEQASTAQAVPEGFVLVKMDDLELLRDSALKIKYASLSNDSDRIFSDIEDIQLSVERLIELQEPAND